MTYISDNNTYKKLGKYTPRVKALAKRLNAAVSTLESNTKNLNSNSLVQSSGKTR